LLCNEGKRPVDEILSDNVVLDHSDRDNKNADSKSESFCSFQQIDEHQEAILEEETKFVAATTMVIVELETGETSYQSRDIIATEGLVNCEVYAKRNVLLDKYGLKRFKRHAQDDKKLERFAIQAKLRSYRCKPFWKFGVRVPYFHAKASGIDQTNGNIYVQDSEALYKTHHMEDKSFLGKEKAVKEPNGFKRVCGQLEYDLKHEDHEKFRYVSNGYLADPNNKSAFSGVVYMQAVRSTVFFVELKSLTLLESNHGKDQLLAYMSGNFGIRNNSCYSCCVLSSKQVPNSTQP
jgi:hypothetical protein